MCLNFSFLAPHLQIEAIKKLEYDSFNLFERSSKYSSKISTAIRTKRALFADEVTIQHEWPELLDFSTDFEEINLSFDCLRKHHSLSVETLNMLRFDSNEELLEMVDRLEKSNLRTQELCFITGDFWDINLALLDRIVKELNSVKSLKILARNASFEDYTKLPLIEKLFSLTLEGNIDDDLLTALRTNNLVVLSCDDAYLTLEGLKRVLQNPKVKSLKLKYPRHLFHPQSETENTEEKFSSVFDELECSILWKSEFHEKSPLSAIPYNVTGVGYTVHSGEKTLLVSFTNGIFFMEQLDENSEKAIRDEAWRKLREFLEDLVDNDYEI